MKNLQCKLTRKRWMEIGVSALLFVLIIAWALVLEYTEPDREATAARKRFFRRCARHGHSGRQRGNPGLDGGPPHRPAVSRGRDSERPVEGRNARSDQLSDHLYQRRREDRHKRSLSASIWTTRGAPYIISIPNYNRAPVLLGLLAIFAALLLLIGRKKGLLCPCWALYTLACVWFIQVPMILRGAQPVVVTVVLVALTTAASLLFLNGFSRKTLCATLGCIGGVAVAGIFRRPVRVNLAAQRLFNPRGGGGSCLRRPGPKNKDRGSRQFIPPPWTWPCPLPLPAGSCAS